MKKISKEATDGQFSLFDVLNEKKPSTYNFQRFVGQKVTFYPTPFGGKEGDIYTITRIEPYYTICKSSSGQIYVGTPTTISPAEEDET